MIIGEDANQSLHFCCTGFVTPDSVESLGKVPRCSRIQNQLNRGEGQHSVAGSLYLHLSWSGDNEYHYGENQGSNQGTRNILARPHPDNPRCRTGEQEESGDRADWENFRYFT